MSKRLRRNAHLIRHLCSCKPSQRKALLKNPSNDLIDCFSEVSLNTLKGRVPIQNSQKTRLARYKRQLRSLASRKTARKTKARLVQKGGFLGAILPVLKTVVGPLATALLGSLK